MTEPTRTTLKLGDESCLFIHHWPGTGDPVVYVHGATFPAALSIGYRFGGKSWADHLHAQGFDVWAFDFIGFGGSSRPPAMRAPAAGALPVGRAAEAAIALGATVDHIRSVRGGARVHLVAHSWGTMVAALLACDRPETVGRLVMFGPFAQREMTGLPSPESIGAWRELSIAEQLKRFVEDVPPGQTPVLLEPDLAEWAPAYLATDPEARTRTPAAVRIPTGPQADIIAAMSGRLAFDPRKVAAPTLIVRGAWDHLCQDGDAAWLMKSLGARDKADVVVPDATHLMHLERGRDGLFAATADWLSRS